jgi:hypothetical protein
LLKGVTPVFKWRALLTCRKPTNTKRDQNRAFFCSDLIIMLAVAEAAALVATTAEILGARTNFGAEPGTPQKSYMLTGANFAIMLFGELVVTDGVVGWLAKTFKKRYVIDPAMEWQRMKTRSTGFLAATALVMSIGFCQILPYLKNSGCITAHAGAEEDWSKTSCPPVPEDITDMLRVGDSYREE